MSEQGPQRVGSFGQAQGQWVDHNSSGHSTLDPAAVQVGGRTFQLFRQGRYYLPNDDGEQDRLDLQHEMFQILFDRRLSLAPIGEPARVLDVATGTGIWVLEFAQQHPKSFVIGTDLSRIQPQDRRGLQNCGFMQEDAEEPWRQSHKLDYIHMRMVFICFDNPKKVLRSAFENLNSGGWIELQDTSFKLDCDDGTYQGSAFHHWVETVYEGMKARGRDVEVARHYRQWLLDIGFVDVVERRFRAPINAWHPDPKLRDVGRYARENISMGFEALTQSSDYAAGLSPDEAERRVSAARADAKDIRTHAYIPIFVVWGRKP